MNALGKFAAGTIMSVISTIIVGFSLMMMWRWFAVPLGLPSIGVLQAIGIRMLVTLPFVGLYMQLGIVNAEEKTSSAMKSTVLSIAALIGLLFAYIIHLLM